MIYSQLGTKHFKLRNYLVKESLRAVLGDMGCYDLLQQVQKRNCLEIQISDLPASEEMSSSCHSRGDPDLPALGVQEGPAGPYPCRAPVAHTEGTVTVPRQRAQRQSWAVNFHNLPATCALSSWEELEH